MREHPARAAGHAKERMDMIGLLSESEIDAVLARHRIGRLGCTANDRPYIVPINYCYDGTSIYAYSAPGRKIEVMREQPLVAFQIDEIESESSWLSVMIEGVYRELSGRERDAAVAQLASSNGLVAKSLSSPDRVIVFRIDLNERSGRFESRDS
jgi:nitroimidazol reductase NimA-like FMN-containing flavoprotein (pyridoxamine 5'-phosphate oxidase superfamily)